MLRLYIINRYIAPRSRLNRLSSWRFRLKRAESWRVLRGFWGLASGVLGHGVHGAMGFHGFMESMGFCPMFGGAWRVKLGAKSEGSGKGHMRFNGLFPWGSCLDHHMLVLYT